jgi:hypothetical protein
MKPVVLENHELLKALAGITTHEATVETELDAASAAGLRTRWLVREATPDQQARHRQVTTFDQINIADCALIEINYSSTKPRPRNH